LNPEKEKGKKQKPAKGGTEKEEVNQADSLTHGGKKKQSYSRKNWQRLTNKILGKTYQKSGKRKGQPDIEPERPRRGES